MPKERRRVASQKQNEHEHELVVVLVRANIFTPTVYLRWNVPSEVIEGRVLSMSWRRLRADDCDWEIRAIAADVDAQAVDAASPEDILEFSAVGAIRPPRRTLVAAGALATMSEAELQAAYRRARPIGGDYYGRPGKRMPDTS